MKRLHVHVSVKDLDESVRFYSQLFASVPSVHKDDYAHSEKSWIGDPQDVQWEAFLTTGESTEYGTDEIRSVQEKRQVDAPCCAPTCCAPGAA